MFVNPVISLTIQHAAEPEDWLLVLQQIMMFAAAVRVLIAAHFTFYDFRDSKSFGPHMACAWTFRLL